MTQLRTFAYGGGVQSTAALVLAAQGRVDFPVFLFANVGEDPEHPKTLTYVRDIAMPYAAANGIELVELRATVRGEVETLVGRMKRLPRSLPIPVRMSNGAPGNRTCTGDFKIHVMARWLRQHGATTANPAMTALGISTDEIHRARTDNGIAWQTLTYPLIDLHLNRHDAHALSGMPGCPRPAEIILLFLSVPPARGMAEDEAAEPDLFQKSVELEDMLNRNRDMLSKDHIYLHVSATPLAQAVGDQMTLWDGNTLDGNTLRIGVLLHMSAGITLVDCEHCHVPFPEWTLTNHAKNCIYRTDLFPRYRAALDDGAGHCLSSVAYEERIADSDLIVARSLAKRCGGGWATVAPVFGLEPVVSHQGKSTGRPKLVEAQPEPEPMPLSKRRNGSTDAVDVAGQEVTHSEAYWLTCPAEEFIVHLSQLREDWPAFLAWHEERITYR